MVAPEKLQDWQTTLDQAVLLNRITTCIRCSLELSEILTAAVTEVRAFLNTDRIMIYRFHPDASGEVVAEAIVSGRLPSLMGLNFPADDIPPHARALFLKARQRVIVNVVEQKVGLSLLDHPETGVALESDEVQYRSVDPCHIAYLTAMGVQSSMVVPIVHRDLRGTPAEPELWGLLVAHHAEPRSISDGEVRIVQQVVDQLSIAIAQAELLCQTRAQAQKEATVNQISTLLHTLPVTQLHIPLEKMVQALRGSGGRLYINPMEGQRSPWILTWGTQPTSLNPETSLEANLVWQQYFQPEDVAVKPLVWAITDLYKVPPLRVLAALFKTTPIRGLLVIPLQYRQQHLGYVSIFRDAIDTETLWAGEFDPDQRQLQPRNSFEAWRELKRGQASAWTQEEQTLAGALGDQFAIAIQQHQLYQQVQGLNTSLELQVQKRTAELEQALESASVLRQVTDQIRSTLNSRTILQTIVREVRNLLDTDRVLVYQFLQGTAGEVIVESVGGSWKSILGYQGAAECFPRSEMNLEGGDRIRAIANIAEADLVPCHLEFLVNVQVKASLMVPIWMGQQLWGLLLAHECRGPRVWRDRDIDLLEQLADQAAIAIQQAELYEQSCTAAATATAQARQLTKAAEQQQALFEVITKIRESLDLQTIFQATAREVRHLLNADRVGVFCFEPSSNYHVGEFVSEDVTAGLTSVLSAKVRDDCFGDEYAPFYLRGRIQVVHDVRSANLSDCHQKILERFQIKANLVVPLIQGDELWGLLCVHQCQAPRRWTTAEIDFVTQIAAQLGVAIQQAELLTQTQRQAEQLTQALQELQQTQTQLIQTEKMSSLGQLVAGVAHEINNPVNFIYGNVNYASEYVRDLLSLLKLYQHHYPAPEAEVQAKAHAIDLEFLADDLPKMLSSMRIGADRIRQIVLSLRNFSRLDQAEKKPVDIHEGIDSTLLILQHRFRATSDSQIISVVKHYGELPLVECYAGQLNQVFMNILSNAIDALQLRNEQLLSEGRPIELGQITITTQLLPEPGDRGGSRVVIQIADNGPGMPETVRSRVFDPFFTTKPVGQGTGLGLSISYQVVVEKHGGVLKCISEPGQGTEFWIEIPIYQGQPST